VTASTFEAISADDISLATVLKRTRICPPYPPELAIARLNRLLRDMLLRQGYFHLEARN
jgi:hypothetical protein